jgi:hypothetical protein
MFEANLSKQLCIETPSQQTILSVVAQVAPAMEEA